MVRLLVGRPQSCLTATKPARRSLSLERDVLSNPVDVCGPIIIVACANEVLNLFEQVLPN
jgi:hypothetical protein